jgi:hypothetical protein
MRELARVWSVSYRAVLPFIVVHEVTLEVESVIDITEAKLDVVVLILCQSRSKREHVIENSLHVHSCPV